MDMHPPTDSELEHLTHVHFTSDMACRPETLDNEVDASIFHDATPNTNAYTPGVVTLLGFDSDPLDTNPLENITLHTEELHTPEPVDYDINLTRCIYAAKETSTLETPDLPFCLPPQKYLGQST
jgi:hypothetical protein